MSDNVITFPVACALTPAQLRERIDRLGANAVAASYGATEEWTHAAIGHLKAASSGRNEGSAEVAVSALHLVLTYLERLETQLGIIQ